MQWSGVGCPCLEELGDEEILCVQLGPKEWLKLYLTEEKPHTLYKSYFQQGDL